MLMPTLSFKENVDTLNVDIDISLNDLKEETTILSEESKLLRLVKDKLIEIIKKENNFLDFQIPKNLSIKLNSLAISETLKVNLTLQGPSDFIAKIV